MHLDEVATDRETEPARSGRSVRFDPFVGVEDVLHPVGSDPDPIVAHVQNDLAVADLRADVHPAGGREANRVADQVREDLLHTIAGGQGERRGFVDAVHQDDAAFLGLGPGQGQDDVRQHAQVHGGELEAGAPALQARQIEDVVHESAEPSAAAANQLEVRSRSFRNLVGVALEQRLSQTRDAEERGAQLV